MESTRFFRIALRLACYRGAVLAAFQLQQQQEQTATAVTAAPSPAAVDPGDGLGPLVNGIRAPKGAKVVSFAEMAAQNPDLIAFQRVGG